AANLAPSDLEKTILELELQKLTPNTIVSRKALLTHLEKIKKQGFAVNEEEEVVGVHGVAAPIFDRSSSVIASIGITIPSYRYKRSTLGIYSRTLMEAAKRISRKIGAPD